MSSTEEIILPRRHRHTRSAAAASTGTTPSHQQAQHPRNSNHLNLEAHSQNNNSEKQTPAQPSTPPRTPRRDTRPAQPNQSSNPHESGTKPKNKNKNRPKNVMTSPAVKGYDRQTPPPTAAQSTGIPSSAKPMNTPSTAVYAGATFHASPAPSSLPIPSFFSKSVPESPAPKGLNSTTEASTSKHIASPLPLPDPTLANEFQREESPLDVFFRADREEKARARSASSANTAGAATGPFPPPESPRHAQTPPALSSQTRPHQGHRSKSSTSGIFAMEMDSPSPGTPYGPAFSTPYAERINAARSGKSLAREESQHSTERSEALKAYLFSGHALPPGPTMNGNGNNDPPPLTSGSSSGVGTTPGFSPRSQQTDFRLKHTGKGSHSSSRVSGRSSGLRQEVTPTKTPTKTPDRNTFSESSPTPSRFHNNISSANQSDPNSRFMVHSTSPASSQGVASADRGANLQGMEDSLRRILKLDSARSSGGTDSSFNSTATTAMPTYAGGGTHP